MPTPTQELLTAGNYALLAYSGITNTGSSVISGGNVGSFPTGSITPGAWTLVPPAIVDNPDAQQARIDGLAAYNYYAGLTPTLSGLGNLSVGGNGATAATYTPGVYVGGSSLDIPTSITLDAQGNANALFVFKSGSTVTLESGQSVLLVNGAQANNVIWVVGSSFTSVATSNMVGNILANTSVTLGGGTLNGRALAVGGGNGAVTISAATIVTAPASSAAPISNLPGRFTFVPRPVTGDMIGASGNEPTGTDGNLYFDVVDGMSFVNSLGFKSGQGDGKRIGFIAYDYVSARWTCLFTTGSNLTPVATTWENDFAQIATFIATLAAPPTLDQAGNYIPYPASVARMNS